MSAESRKNPVILPIEAENSAEQLSLRGQYRRTLRNFYNKMPLVEGPINEGPVHDRRDLVGMEIETVSAEASAITERTNAIARLLHRTSEYRHLRNIKEALKGPSELLLGFCVDGRIKRVLFGLTVNTWEVPAGEIVAVKRWSYQKLIPESVELKTSLSEYARKGKEVLEIFLAHFDSRDNPDSPEHGCAAIAQVREALSLTEKPSEFFQNIPPVELDRYEALGRMNTQRRNVLGPVADEILHTVDPLKANLILLEKKSLEAIKNWLDSEREKYGFGPQKIVGIAAAYDTATKGIVFNPLLEKEQQLATTDVVTRYKNSLAFAASHVAPFGKYKHEEGVTPENLLQFSQDQLRITEMILEPIYPLPTNITPSEIIELRGREFVMSNLTRFGFNFKAKVSKVPQDESMGYPNKLYEEIENYVNTAFRKVQDGEEIDLTDSQKQSLRFFIAQTLAKQFLKGLTGADHHTEGYASVALGGEIAGKYDTEQMFGSNPADEDTLLSQLELELGVINQHRPDIKRPIIFVSTAIDRRAYDDRENGGHKDYAEAMANNLRIYEKITRNRKLKYRITPLGVLIDRETREIIEVLDHSSSL